MEELLNIAMAYYQASSDHHQKLARDFFGAMDHDGDGRIDQNEFIKFLVDEGYAQMTKPCFFKQLDHDKNGTLDFFEVMMLYYILKSGRPFCDRCNMFIPNTYFTCVGCLEDEGGVSVYLCLKCYTEQKCDHTHNGLSRYVDNYSLLEDMLKSNLSRARSRPSETDLVSDKPSSSSNQAWNPSSAMNQVPNRPPPIPNQHLWSQCVPTAPLQNSPFGNNHAWNDQSLQVPPTPPLQNVSPIVYHQTYIQNNYSYNHTPPHLVQTPVVANAIDPQRQQWKVAFEALNTALYVSAIGGNLCSIL